MRLHKLPKADIDARVKKVAQTLGIGDVLERRPRELSVGQRQRVALGGAIVREPRVFLMDEPLSNLDAALRTDMRSEIIKLQDGAASDGVYSLRGKIDTIEPLGHTTLVRAELPSADVLSVLASGKLPWSMGDPIYATFRPEHIYLFDRKNEQTLSGVAT